MTNITQLILHVQEARGMLALVERELREFQGAEQATIAEARAALRAAWESARASTDKQIMTPARWLMSSGDNAALAGSAGFSDILEAAAWLEGARA